MRNLVAKRKQNKLIGSMSASKKAGMDEARRAQTNFLYALWKAIATKPDAFENEQKEAGPHKIHVHAGMTRAGTTAGVADGAPDTHNDGPHPAAKLQPFTDGGENSREPRYQSDSVEPSDRATPN